MSNQFPRSVQVPKNKIGRRLVIPDIHGCITTFSALIDKIGLTKKDHLFLLGDYIDRGPSSASVLDFIITLQAQGYTIFPIRGNHEQMLLDEIDKDPDGLKGYLTSFNSLDLWQQNGIPITYQKLIKNTYFYIELDDFFLVHAGFNSKIANPLTDFEAMLWIRDFEPIPEKLKNKYVVHGHDPTSLTAIKNHLNSRSLKLPLDNGCVHFGKFDDMGKLICLNLDTFSLIEQANLDF